MYVVYPTITDYLAKSTLQSHTQQLLALATVTSKDNCPYKAVPKVQAAVCSSKYVCPRMQSNPLIQRYEKLFT